MVLIKSNTLGRYHNKYIISIIKHKGEANINKNKDLSFLNIMAERSMGFSPQHKIAFH